MKKPTIVLLAIAATVTSIAVIQPFSNAVADTYKQYTKPTPPSFINNPREWFNQNTTQMKEAVAYCDELKAMYNLGGALQDLFKDRLYRVACRPHVYKALAEYCGSLKHDGSNKSDPWCRSNLSAFPAQLAEKYKHKYPPIRK